MFQYEHELSTGIVTIFGKPNDRREGTLHVIIRPDKGAEEDSFEAKCSVVLTLSVFIWKYCYTMMQLVTSDTVTLLTQVTIMVFC